MIVSRLKEVWQEVTLLSAWIVTVTGAFIIPLPAWYSSDENTPLFTKFGVFVATVIAGFLILYSLRNKSVKIWTILSVSFFMLLIITYTAYYFIREAKTLPYLEKDIVIGNETVEDNPFALFKETHGFLPDRKERMMIVLGDPEKVWTRESILANRIQLMLLLFLCYLFSAGFIISFCNLIILYKKKYPLESAEK